ncbi:MAG: hypothetical protein U1F61_06115 [Opitutaceae bacterium]
MRPCEVDPTNRARSESLRAANASTIRQKASTTPEGIPASSPLSRAATAASRSRFRTPAKAEPSGAVAEDGSVQLQVTLLSDAAP